MLNCPRTYQQESMLYLVFSLYFGWRLCLACDPISDLDVSKCQGLCKSCNVLRTLWPGTDQRRYAPINVAQNRPSFISKARLCSFKHELDCYCLQENSLERTRNHPCGANNGLIANFLSTGCKGYPYNCIRTTYSTDILSGWWNVDLERPVTVLLLVIYGLRAGESITSMYTLMVDMMLIVDAQLCTETENDVSKLENKWRNWKPSSNEKTSPGIRFVYWCTQPVRGRYVRVQKYTNAIFRSPVSFCEFQVFSCPSGTSAVQSTWKENGDFSCEPCSCSQHPCDNYYGCYLNTEAPYRSHNLIIHRPVTVLSQDSTRPAEFLVDGVYRPPDFRCYRSSFAPFDSSLRSSHYAKVVLDGLHQVMRVKVVNFAGFENSYSRFQVWTARQNDELCYEMEGPFREQFEATCSSCLKGLRDCPRALFATFRDAGNSQYLALCEIILYGFRIKEIKGGKKCNYTCQLEFCEASLVCNNNICRVEINQTCSENEDCAEQGRCEGQKCKLPVHANCSQRSDLCASGLVCSRNTCKMDLGTGPCTSDNDCANYSEGSDTISAYVCDYSHKCRQKVHSTCSADTVCPAGAKCQSRSCECTTQSSGASQHICEPIVIHKSCALQNDCATLANSDCKDGKCECTEGFTLNDRDLSCSVDVGHTCSNSTPCSGTMTCQNSVCYIVFQTSCNPTKEGECETGTACDTERRRCLYIPDHHCNSSEQCQTGSFCQDKKCKIARGKACNGSQPAVCESGHECAVAAGDDPRTKCVPVVGGACDGDGLCPNGTICYEIYFRSFCRVDILQKCVYNSSCREDADCVNGQCRWKIGSQCGSDKSACGPDAVCDLDKTCRYQVGQNCSRLPSFCRLRSFCNVNKRCECLEIANNASNTCELKPESNGKIPSLLTSACVLGDENSVAQPCGEAKHGKCDAETSTCMCDDGYAPTANLKCLPKAGFLCEGDVDVGLQGCAQSSVCVNGVCRLPVGQVCRGSETLYCVSGTVCDTDGLCRMNVGSDCDNPLSNLCQLSLVCDRFHKCKLPVGAERCYTDSNCVVGAKCSANLQGIWACTCDPQLSQPDNTGQCIIKHGEVGADCSGGRKCKDANADCNEQALCWCKEGFEVSEVDLNCKVAEDYPCSASQDCTPGKVCDTKLLLCKRDLGSACNNSHSETGNCQTGTVCDDDSLCKVNEEGLCDTDEKRTHCKIGTSCDLLGLCKKGFHHACNKSEECGAGMLCSSGNICACNPASTSTSLGWCLPLQGKLGSSCDPRSVVSQCAGSGSICSETTGTCKCADISTVSARDLTCRVLPATDLDETPPSGLVMLLVIMSLIVLLLMVVGLLYHIRGAKRKKAMVEVLAKRRNTIMELASSAGALNSKVEKEPSFASSSAVSGTSQSNISAATSSAVSLTSSELSAAVRGSDADVPEKPAPEVAFL